MENQIEYFKKFGFFDKIDFTAMEKWTGWHASIMAIQIANKKIPSGAYPVELALNGKVFYTEGKKRGILSVLLQAFYDIEYCFLIASRRFPLLKFNKYLALSTERPLAISTASLGLFLASISDSRALF